MPPNSQDPPRRFGNGGTKSSLQALNTRIVDVVDGTQFFGRPLPEFVQVPVEINLYEKQPAFYPGRTREKRFFKLMERASVTSSCPCGCDGKHPVHDFAKNLLELMGFDVSMNGHDDDRNRLLLSRDIPQCYGLLAERQSFPIPDISLLDNGRYLLFAQVEKVRDRLLQLLRVLASEI